MAGLVSTLGFSTASSFLSVLFSEMHSSFLSSQGTPNCLQSLSKSSLDNFSLANFQYAAASAGLYC
jgi:hypothetical protein